MAAKPDAPETHSGRVVKRTPQVIEAYLDALRQGARRGAAAQAAGVTRTTINEWKHDDPDFAAAEIAAELEANELVEDALFQAAVSGNVTAIQVWLYNRMGSRWADRRGSIAVTGAGGGPIEAELVAGRRYDELTDDELREAEERQGAAAVAAAESIIAATRRSGSKPPESGAG